MLVLAKLSPMNWNPPTSLTCHDPDVGQAHLDDGTTLGGFGEGTWERVESQNRWIITMLVDISDGSRHRSVGEISLETLMFTGKIFEIDGAAEAEVAGSTAEPA